MAKGYLKAWEVEKEMQEKREMADIIGKTETTLVTQMVKSAKANNRLGDKLLLVVDPLYIHIPNWQRRTELHHAMNIGTQYDKNRWDAPKIFVQNGKLICVDGKHRIYGAYKAGKKDVVVEILEIDETEAIKIFLSQSQDRKKMSPSDTYIAAITAGIPEYVQLREIANKNGVNIKGDNASVTNPVGTLTSISDGIKMIKKDAEQLDRILGLIKKLQWNGKNGNGKAYGAKMLRVLDRLFAYYKGNEGQVERALVVNCKGSKFFENNIAERSQSMTFDYLSNIIDCVIKSKNIVVA